MNHRLRCETVPKILCKTCELPKRSYNRSEYCRRCYRALFLNDQGQPAPKHTLPPDPLGPTDAQPGSEEKIKILCDRARRGVALFHPLDHTVKGPPGVLGIFERRASRDE